MLFKKNFELLTNAAKAGKLPQALLFYGQEGIGKRNFAINFAEQLIGKNIENGTNPDFVLVEPEKKNIQIKQIRDLTEKLSFRPYMADFKIGILNDAHLMNKEAQNCFLKFLEEPTDKTHLILVTAFPFMLLPTVLSRVQKIWLCPERGFKPEYNKEFAGDFEELAKADLAFRFQYAKKKEEENLDVILNSWAVFLRECLFGREKTDYPTGKIKSAIENIQKTKNILSSTNVNPKLALEILLMEL
ncbi:MAG: hypothetical protein Q8N69_03650 [bacterium]|nr:hypothetical protein [bacterium]